jgi:M6 family metalloprotease-like protein
MTRSVFRMFLGLAFLGALPWFLGSPDPARGQQPAAEDLADFRTVETAITTRISKAAPTTSGQAGYLGVHLAANDRGQVTVAHVQTDSPAARAGLERGDLLARVGGQAVRAPDDLRQFLAGKSAGEKVPLDLLRAGQPMVVTATLGVPSQPLPVEQGVGGGGKGKGKGGGSWDLRKGFGAWKKPVYRLAVVCVEYSDAKHNDKITPKAWEDALFTRGTYKTSVTGQTAYGSLNDYYLEQSYGNFRVEGKVFPFVLVIKKRQEYGQGKNRTALLTEALDKLLARDGKDALDGFDGIFFMYAGGRTQAARGSLYWPHKSQVSHQGKRWPYFICPEGGTRMADISVITHEFGHMLGLPDLYARPENPGSEGMGIWCVMSNQAGKGRPQHMSAWCKERLGWLTPTVIDPTTRQKLILAPVYQSSRECYKVLAHADGSEYYLLENRGGKGFDASLPAQGLLVWRVVRGRPMLEESHGVSGPAGPRSYPTSVPFPSKVNDAFTPYTVPSSRSQLGGGLPVHITNIRRLPDGRITFAIGWEFF